MIERIRHIAVAAPAGRIAPEALAAGVDFWRARGKTVTVLPHVTAGAPEFYLAAPAALRAAELEAAWLDESIDAIWCARGGFGSAHLLELLDWERLRARRPALPVVGYSDITALHLAMLARRCGVPVAAPMIGRIAAAAENAEQVRALEAALGDAPGVRPVFTPTVYRAGAVTNALPLAANLAVLTTLAGTGFLPDPTGRVLILEDVNEPVYKLDRYLTHLGQLGWWERVAAVVFGEFLDCAPPADLERLCARVAQRVNGPVIAGFPFGHGAPPLALNMTKGFSIGPTGVEMNQ